MIKYSYDLVFFLNYCILINNNNNNNNDNNNYKNNEIVIKYITYSKNM
jgi:hypothetical protein